MIEIFIMLAGLTGMMFAILGLFWGGFKKDYEKGCILWVFCAMAWVINSTLKEFL